MVLVGTYPFIGGGDAITGQMSVNLMHFILEFLQQKDNQVSLRQVLIKIML